MKLSKALVVITKPGGTGMPAAVMVTKEAPLPPRISSCGSMSPSKYSIYAFDIVVRPHSMSRVRGGVFSLKCFLETGRRQVHPVASRGWRWRVLPEQFWFVTWPACCRDNSECQNQRTGALERFYDRCRMLRRFRTAFRRG